VIHLRNAHPKATVYLPVAAGWARIVRPGVTTMLPAAVLHTTIARQLLVRRMIELVDGTASDADARQRSAARTDMARAIALAEQAEFDRLLQGERIKQGPRRQRRPRPKRPRKRRQDEWPPERVELIKCRLAAGASRAEIAAELGVKCYVVSALIYRRAKAARRGPTEAARADAPIAARALTKAVRPEGASAAFLSPA
jgi:hypothetical protein